MKLKSNLMVAAASVVLAGSAVAGTVVYPGGDLGLLDVYPDSFLSVKSTAAATAFSDETFTFTLGTTSKVLGSWATFGALNISGLTIDGLAPAITGTDFSAVLGSGKHVLSFSGMSTGFAGYTGSVYATAVPEPESLALALAGVGVTVSVMRRRSRA